MNGEIITVGTELLLGGIVNTNSQYISRELAALGVNVYFQVTVGDNPSRLKKMLSQAVNRSEVIIITGGLGPTADDITKETVSAAIGRPMYEDKKSLEAIKSFFAKMGKEMSETNRK